MTADAILAATIPSVLPTMMVLVGILLNKNDINSVRTSISELRGEINSMRAQFQGELSSIRSEISGLRTQFHNDIMTLVNISNDLDKRISRLEDKG